MLIESSSFRFGLSGSVEEAECFGPGLVGNKSPQMATCQISTCEMNAAITAGHPSLVPGVRKRLPR